MRGLVGVVPLKQNHLAFYYRAISTELFITELFTRKFGNRELSVYDTNVHYCAGAAPIPSNSTSKISVELGGMVPAPASP